MITNEGCSEMPYPNNIAKKQLLTSKIKGNMDGGAITTKDMKVEINSSTEPENISPTSENVTTGGLARQGSMSKNSCLCSPTTHAGSFRCRLHRAPTTTNTNLQRTKSIESNPKANPNAYTTC
ncbi:hypothetical protein KY284_023347 [Solanum tuberosum]|nr:hypothetical protein KY284_023347 [Solanum tuberosum]